MTDWLPLLIAALALVCVPLAPRILQLRIRFFRWIKWNFAADLLERHFSRWVLLGRSFLFLLAALLLAVFWPT